MRKCLICGRLFEEKGKICISCFAQEALDKIGMGAAVPQNQPAAGFAAPVQTQTIAERNAALFGDIPGFEAVKNTVSPAPPVRTASAVQSESPVRSASGMQNDALFGDIGGLTKPSGGTGQSEMTAPVSAPEAAPAYAPESNAAPFAGGMGAADAFGIPDSSSVTQQTDDAQAAAAESPFTEEAAASPFSGGGLFDDIGSLSAPKD